MVVVEHVGFGHVGFGSFKQVCVIQFIVGTPDHNIIMFVHFVVNSLAMRGIQRFLGLGGREKRGSR